MSFLDMLEKANEDRIIKVEFEIKAGTESKKVVMTRSDVLTIQKEQTKTYELELAALIADGFDTMQVNESKWKDYEAKQKESIRDLEPEQKETALKTLKESRPKNLAEQLAREFTFSSTLKLMGKILKGPDGRPLFRTATEQERFGEIVLASPDLQMLLMENFNKFIGRMKEVAETSKNSKGQEQTSSDSNASCPESTDTGDHSTPD